MIKLVRSTFVMAIVALLLLSNLAVISAQSPSIDTGIVTTVETKDSGELIGFSIIKGDGSVMRFAVSPSNPNTKYGLENRVGDRWVSDQATEPKEAAKRLMDQQSRLAQISIQSDGTNVATSVVQAMSTDVDTNLGYLFAVVAIAWTGIMGYVVYMGLRQRTIAADLSRLVDDDENNDF